MAIVMAETLLTLWSTPSALVPSAEGMHWGDVVAMRVAVSTNAESC